MIWRLHVDGGSSPSGYARQCALVAAVTLLVPPLPLAPRGAVLNAAAGAPTDRLAAAARLRLARRRLLRRLSRLLILVARARRDATKSATVTFSRPPALGERCLRVARRRRLLRRDALGYPWRSPTPIPPAGRRPCGTDVGVQDPLDFLTSAAASNCLHTTKCG